MSDGKRGASAPYGDYWKRWRKVNYLYQYGGFTDKLIILIWISFGVASAHGDEWESCVVLPRATNT